MRGNGGQGCELSRAAGGIYGIEREFAKVAPHGTAQGVAGPARLARDQDGQGARGQQPVQRGDAEPKLRGQIHRPRGGPPPEHAGETLLRELLFRHRGLARSRVAAVRRWMGGEKIDEKILLAKFSVQ